MATIVDGAKPALDAGRALLQAVGLRDFSVVLRVTNWSGSRVGEGMATTTLTPITVAGGKNVDVRPLSPRQVVASGGQLGDTMFDIGPITPKYAGGGMLPEQVNPPKARNREVHYLLRGPGLPVDGAVCKLIADTHKPFRIMLRVQMTGETP